MYSKNYTGVNLGCVFLIRYTSECLCQHNIVWVVGWKYAPFPMFTVMTEIPPVTHCGLWGDQSELVRLSIHGEYLKMGSVHRWLWCEFGAIWPMYVSWTKPNITMWHVQRLSQYVVLNHTYKIKSIYFRALFCFFHRLILWHFSRFVNLPCSSFTSPVRVASIKRADNLSNLASSK